MKHWPTVLQNDFDRAMNEIRNSGLEDMLGAGEIEKLRQYINLLLYWSERMNLIATRDRDYLPTKHILPALLLLSEVRALPHKTIIDFGSGAGLPGIPLKIALPEIEIILLESRRKRAHFLKEVVRRLGLKGIRAVNQRIEQMESMEKVELVVTRAAAEPDKLIHLVKPLLKPYGSVVSYLSQGLVKEKKTGNVSVLYQKRMVGCASGTIGILAEKWKDSKFKHLSTSWL